MKEYDHKAIESKWQKQWEKEKIYKAEDKSKKPKYYCLIEFPYPSGDGLHVGHVRPYIAMDIISRKRRMEDYNVLYPIGWDAFGLPTENYAIKTKTPPKIVTKQNTDNFRRQIKMLGISFDWSREINTTDPKYYKWTQWIFLQLFKHGLAYKKKTAINWCIDCKIGLANEEVVGGLCERCGGGTEKREKEQWMLAITKYADRLYDDLDSVDYLERIKIQQRNWIGRSNGAEITFKLHYSSQTHADPTQNNAEIKVFTTRPDTLFGATYMVLAPEHELIKNLKLKIKNYDEVEGYIVQSKKKSEIERTTEGKEKTGVKLEGVTAINPANKEEIPIFIADYVLKEYGTGAIMAVPAHDDRDLQFAIKYGLDIRRVIRDREQPSGEKELQAYGVVSINAMRESGFAWTYGGILMNSGKFNGIDSEEAKKKITEAVGGKWTTTYKLRDWVFSRQRYWGEPIPLIFCEACAKKSKARTNADLTRNNAEGIDLNPGWIAVPEKDLPLELPEVKNYTPTDTGESPLAKIDSWVNVKCPSCGGPARRETDTMPQWAGSSWYCLRYIDPHNGKALADRKKLDHFMPVDWYNGGMEHTTLHLLYSRFWHKFLFDIGVVPGSEPYAKRTSHGMILAESGEKMSKSKGNVVNPDKIVATYGADTLRLYEMFIGPFDQAVAWSDKSIIGPRRFLERVWKLQYKIGDAVPHKKLEAILHKAIKKVGEDIEKMHFNTAVSELMILVNEMEKQDKIPRDRFELLLRILAPFAPHICEELWALSGHKTLINQETWPTYDKTKLVSPVIIIAVQVNGKMRGEFETAADTEEKEIKERALNLGKVLPWIEGKIVKRVIYVRGKLVSIVAE